ncbi:MAG: hypothetical protein L6282_01845 [Candidatus Methanoperedenaceae archaeon]|nr:hypothetical protein [Candidatus Methanoperedenaceae archaeon]
MSVMTGQDMNEYKNKEKEKETEIEKERLNMIEIRVNDVINTMNLHRSDMTLIEKGLYMMLIRGVIRN